MAVSFSIEPSNLIIESLFTEIFSHCLLKYGMRIFMKHSLFTKILGLNMTYGLTVGMPTYLTNSPVAI